MTRHASRAGFGIAVFLGVALLASGPVGAYPSKAAKEAKRLSEAGQDAEEAMQGVVAHVRKMIEDYNAILDGSVKNRESAYKRLAGDLGGARKKIDAANRSVDDMTLRAGDYFAEWESELDGYSTEPLRQKSLERLDRNRQYYDVLAASLRESGETFTPLLEHLDDQILFLGRDLSPDAIAALGDEPETLNRQADDVFDTVEGLMARARGVETAGTDAYAD